MDFLTIVVEKKELARRLNHVVRQVFPRQDVRYLVVEPVATFRREVMLARAQAGDYPRLVDVDVQLEDYTRRLVGVPYGDCVTFWDSPLAYESLMASDHLVVFYDREGVAYRIDRDRHRSCGNALRSSECRVLRSLTSTEISRQFISPDLVVGVENIVHHGRVRHYFNVQFAVNAMGVLALLPAVQGRFLSKYQVQLLYEIAKQPPRTLSVLHHVMNEWPGGLGSVLSRGEIIRQLQDGGWIKNGCNGFVLSGLGSSLLSQLHPECEDPGLPGRLQGWCALPFEKAKCEMDSYLMTWFGRQRKFMQETLAL